jgi:hypothetical protein
LSYFQAFEAQAFEGRSLRVPHARLHFAFAIGIAHTTRQGHRTVVGQQIAIQRIDGGIVEVGSQDAFA